MNLQSTAFRNIRLSDRQHQIGLGLGSLGLMILLGTIAIAPTIATLECQRQSAYYSLCTVTNRSFLWIPLRQIRLDPLTGSQALPSRSSPTWSNRVMLYRSGGREIPFTVFSTDGISVQRSVTQINAFLGDPKIPRFFHLQFVPWQVLITVLSGAMILLFAGVMLLKIQ